MNNNSNNNIKFIESQSQGYKNLAKWVTDKVNSIGYSMDQVMSMSDDELKNLVVRMNPINIRMITSYLNIIGLYARWTDNIDLYNRISEFDRKEIWEYCDKTNTNKIFISKEEFNDLINDISFTDECNAEFNIALLTSIYEGIYSNDMSVLSNLRASNIHGNIVTLEYSTGDTFNMEISEDLSDLLNDISRTDVRMRKNGEGVYAINVNGEYEDSCFKFDKSVANGKTKNRFYYRMRKISNEYLDFNLKAQNLYISGIMYRINKLLEENGYNIIDVFENDRKFGSDIDVIRKELERINYKNDFKYLRQRVFGYVDIFTSKK